MDKSLKKKVRQQLNPFLVSASYDYPVIYGAHWYSRYGDGGKSLLTFGRYNSLVYNMNIHL
jgi:hypothetical protein